LQLLRDLAMGDEAAVHSRRARSGNLSDVQLQRARSFTATYAGARHHHQHLPRLVHASHVARAANADVMQGSSLLERAASCQEEAWEELLEQMRKQPDESRRSMRLFGTRKPLFNFLAKRAEWWASPPILLARRRGS
jgi:hypothetical protein